MSFPDVEHQLEVIRRGAVDLVSIDQLRARLEKSRQTGNPLRVKLGIDPTSPDVHLGHSVVIRKLRDFQDLGHKAVLILGDGTALVGDPTGRDSTRPPLTREKIEENVAGYLAQIGKILDISKTEIVRNGDWFHKMDFADTLRLLARGTVARMLERDNFTDRIKAGKAIHVHELVYPLMQGWDSVMVRADVELGGTDQLFNLMQGRHLQAEEGQPSQVILTTPILEGLDGRKMSKSYGNHIGLLFPPKEIFGRTMSIPDSQLRSWFTLLTRVPDSEISELLKEGKNPRDAKVLLAKLLIEELHDKNAAEREDEAFTKQFSKREVPEDIQIIHLGVNGGFVGNLSTLDSPRENPTPDIALYKQYGIIIHYALNNIVPDLSRLESDEIGINNFPQLIAKVTGRSGSQVRDLIRDSAVEIDKITVQDPKATVWLKEGSLLRVGKRQFYKIHIYRKSLL